MNQFYSGSNLLAHPVECMLKRVRDTMNAYFKAALHLILMAGLVSCANVNVSGLADAIIEQDWDKLQDYGEEYLNKRQKQHLSLADIEPRLSNTPLENIKFKGVDYIYLGIPEYDNFFRSAAKINGLVQINREMSSKSTKNLKKYAMSKYSNKAMRQNIKELVGNKRPEKWSNSENIAVMKMAKAQGKITQQERQYFAQSAGYLALCSASLVRGIDAAYDLIKTGKRLQKSKKQLKDTEALIAAEGLAGSLKNLESATRNGPAMVEELTVLASAFKALGN